MTGRKQIDLPMALLLTGLTIAFLAKWLGYSVDFGGNSVGTGTFRYNIVAYGLILVGAFISFINNNGGTFWKQSRYRTWIISYLFLLAIMVARSVLEGADFVRVIWDTTFYLTVVVMFIGQQDSLWPHLNHWIVIITTLAVLYSVYCIVTFNLPSGESYFERSIINDTAFSVLPELLIGVPFLLFTYGNQSGWGKFIAIFGCLILAFIGILTQGRDLTLRGILPFILASFIGLRTGQVQNAIRRVSIKPIMLMLVLGSIVALTLNDQWVSHIGLEQSWEALVARSTTQDTVLSTTLSDYRFTEAQIVAQWMSWDQWLFGTGVSGTWSEPNAYGGESRNMVHIGYMQFIFKGGILLLLLFLLIPIGIGWKAFFRSHDTWTLAAGAMVVYESVNWLNHGYVQPSMGWVLLFLYAGRLATCTARKNCALESV